MHETRGQFTVSSTEAEGTDNTVMRQRTVPVVFYGILLPKQKTDALASVV